MVQERVDLPSPEILQTIQRSTRLLHAIVNNKEKELNRTIVQNLSLTREIQLKAAMETV